VKNLAHDNLFGGLRVKIGRFEI